MKKIVITIAGLLVGLLVLPLCGFAEEKEEKQHFCNNYADIAIGQYTLGKQYNLPNIVPPAWSDNREGHYNWCMVVPQNMAESETAKRKAYLDQYLPETLSAKKVPKWQKVSSAVKNGVSGVAATPISIPRPIKVKTQEAMVQKAGYVALRDIEKAALISLDKNLMQVKLRYRVEPSVADQLYAGAFLYDADMQAINAGYKPTRELKSPEGDVDITLVLPEEPFHAATIEVFLLQSGKVIVKKYFKCPLVWNGREGTFFRSTVAAGVVNTQQNVPGFVKLPNEGGKQPVLVGHGSLISLDPGRGP